MIARGAVVLAVVLVGIVLPPVSAEPPDQERLAGRVMAAAGDISCLNNKTTGPECRADATGDLIRAETPNKVLPLGDLQYEDGRLADFRTDYHSVWGSFYNITRPVPGNHEYHIRNADGFYDYWGNRGNREVQGFQSFTTGTNWLVVGINTNCAKVSCANQRVRLEDWLDATAQQGVTCQLVYSHHPMYSSGYHGNTPSVASNFRSTMNQYGVDLLLSGHDHNYERFAPVNGDTFRQFVAGTGGKEIRPFRTPKPGSQVRIGELGVLFLGLKAGGYDFEFRQINGSGGDFGSGTCVGAP